MVAKTQFINIKNSLTFHGHINLSSWKHWRSLKRGDFIIHNFQYSQNVAKIANATKYIIFNDNNKSKTSYKPNSATNIKPISIAKPLPPIAQSVEPSLISNSLLNNLNKNSNNTPNFHPSKMNNLYSGKNNLHFPSNLSQFNKQYRQKRRQYVHQSPYEHQRARNSNRNFSTPHRTWKQKSAKGDGGKYKGKPPNQQIRILSNKSQSIAHRNAMKSTHHISDPRVGNANLSSNSISFNNFNSNQSHVESQISFTDLTFPITSNINPNSAKSNSDANKTNQTKSDAEYEEL